MHTRALQGLQIILNDKTANGIGVPIDVSNYKNITLQVRTKNSAALTVKFAASMSLKAPTFSSSASYTNFYDYVQITPLNDQTTPLAGSTGIVLSGTDKLALYEIDCNLIKWLCPIVSGYSAGDITVEMNACNDF